MGRISIITLKVEGSTLVETLVAFTILLICISMAAMIFVGVFRSSGKFDYLDAWITVENMATESKNKQDYTDLEFAFSNFRIKRSIVHSSFTPSVYILELRVFDSGNHLRISYKSLIQLKDDPNY
jgi:hypothetical protein